MNCPHYKRHERKTDFRLPTKIMKNQRLNSCVSTELLYHMVRDGVPVKKQAYFCFPCLADKTTFFILCIIPIYVVNIFQTWLPEGIRNQILLSI